MQQVCLHERNEIKTKITDTMMKFSNLSIGYNKKIIMKLTDLVFEKGKFISVLGPNGAGKTTLLRTMARLLKPLKGSVFIENKPLQEFKRSELAKKLSVVLTNRVSMDLFSVFEFVALGRYSHTGFLGKLNKKDKQIVFDALTMVHADSLIERKFDTLSDGEKQKVLLARALSQEPQLIILDEPTLHLDLKHRLEMMSILQKLCRQRKITVIASLHDVDIASKVSDNVILVKNGRMAGFGTPEEILDSKNVADLYDLKGASFNPELGSIEINGNHHKAKVFVAGGMGRGTDFYRLLARHGFAISTGVLHGNDLDYFVARSLGAECVTCPPMEKITAKETDKACTLICQADYFVDAGFFIGKLNQANAMLVSYAVNMDKPVFTLRNREEFSNFFSIKLNGRMKNTVFCKNKVQLTDKMDNYLK